MAKAIIRAWVVTMVGAALLATAGSASAGTATIAGSIPHYDGSPGEQNALIVSHVAGAYRFEDPVGVTAGQGCLSVTPTVAECPTSRPQQVVVKLGDLSDSVQVLDPSCHCLGGSGDDSLQGSATPDWLEGEAGNDTLHGGDGNDRVEGNKDSDTLYGDDGRDDVRAGPGVNDVLDGGPGDDDLTGGRMVTGGAGNDFLGSGVYVLTNTLLGESGDDILFGGQDAGGGPGDDLLVARGTPNDRLDGGPGIDTAEYPSDPGGIVSVSLDGNANDGVPDFSEHDNVLPTIENLRGGYGNDRLTGDADANQLFGGEGDDRLNGRGGDDALFGEFGNDTLIGGNNADLLDGGDDVDTANYSDQRDAVTASLDGVANDGATDVDCATAACPGPPGDNALAENLVGGRNDDELTGDDGPNALAGNLGADTLLGLDGNDDLLARDNVADLLLDCDGGHDIARFDTFLDPDPIDCETLNPRH